MKMPFFEEPFKYCSSFLVKIIQEMGMLWKMHPKTKKVGSQLRLQTDAWAVGVGAEKHLTTSLNLAQICLTVQHYKTWDFLSPE